MNKKLKSAPADVDCLITEMLGRSGSSDQVFPATELYNETWMLRLVVDWFSRNEVPGHPLNFAKGCRWFSEGQIPTQFQPTSRKDKLGEAWTHADCVIGHFEVGQKAKTDTQLSANATHLVCLEAKMFSKLSPGVSHASYYNQAARYVACMAEMLCRANRKPGQLKHFGFYVVAPVVQINNGAFRTQVERSNIRDIVKRRVSEYAGEKDLWFEQWFLRTLEKIEIECLSWESIITTISEVDPDEGSVFKLFYGKCHKYNRPMDLSS